MMPRADVGDMALLVPASLNASPNVCTFNPSAPVAKTRPSRAAVTIRASSSLATSM